MIRTIKTVVSVITVVTSAVVALTELKKAIDGFKRKRELENDSSSALKAQTT
jgi:Mrp family chromosome partitioning ATPase